MRLVTTDNSLNCARLKKTSPHPPKIANDTKVGDLVQLQEDPKLHLTEYHFQMIINAVAVEAIVAVVDDQYIDELR